MLPGASSAVERHSSQLQGALIYSCCCCCSSVSCTAYRLPCRNSPEGQGGIAKSRGMSNLLQQKFCEQVTSV